MMIDRVAKILLFFVAYHATEARTALLSASYVVEYFFFAGRE